jgi:ABC-type transporter Mla subunit MlaD
MFGGNSVTTVHSGSGRQYDVPPDASPAVAQPSSADAAQHLERTLAHFESMLSALEQRAQSAPAVDATVERTAQELDELRSTLRDVFQRLEGTLDHLGTEAQRLSDGASDLALVAGRLDTRMNELIRSVGSARSVAPPPEPAAERAPVAIEPKFQPGDDAVAVVLAAVPGFQGLMDAQRALSGLDEAENASVVAYKNGEASLQVQLRAPVSARQIVEGLRVSTGHQLLIEESRPEALRLRLRFTGGDGDASA